MDGPDQSLEQSDPGGKFQTKKLAGTNSLCGKRRVKYGQQFGELLTRPPPRRSSTNSGSFLNLRFLLLTFVLCGSP